MIINMTGGGGGGLNLSVVGGTSRPGGSDTLYWDGNTEGLESVAVQTVMFYKVSDALPSHEDIVQGGTFVQTQFEGEQLSIDFTAEYLESGDGYTGIFNAFIVVVRENNSVIYGSTFPSKGIYFQVNQVGYISSFQINGYTFGGGSVKDNTIWVNTDTAINGYAFSTDEPANPVEGMVWFQTGTVSGAAMNVDKKNMVMIYPNSCSQYISGEWVSKTAKTYLAGAWQDWKRYLYRAGDTDTGFVGVGWRPASGGYAKAPQITYNADSVVFTATTDQYGGTGCVAHFPDMVDLTEYTTLTADATLAGLIHTGNRPEGLYIWSAIGGSTYPAAAVASALFGDIGNKILTIDVSELSGEYYIGFGLRYEGSPAETITLREVTLE